MNVELIEETIHELEHQEPTYDICQKLASLYIIKEYYRPSVISKISKVEDELNDILPRYKDYVDIKKKYQLGEITENKVIDSLKSLCIEIKQFIRILYSSTDLETERIEIQMLINALKEIGR